LSPGFPIAASQEDHPTKEGGKQSRTSARITAFGSKREKLLFFKGQARSLHGLLKVGTPGILHGVVKSSFSLLLAARLSLLPKEKAVGALSSSWVGIPEPLSSFNLWGDCLPVCLDPGRKMPHRTSALLIHQDNLLSLEMAKNLLQVLDLQICGKDGLQLSDSQKKATRKDMFQVLQQRGQAHSPPLETVERARG
jgi:hypothetical protein